MAKTAFRRIHGRIVPVRMKEDNKQDLLKLGGAIAIGAAAALAAGRLAPPGGLSAATPKVRKLLSFHATRALGITALGSSGLAGLYASNLVKRNYKDKETRGMLTAGVAAATVSAVGTLLPRIARIGRAWRTSSALRYAVKGSKFIPGI